MLLPHVFYYDWLIRSLLKFSPYVFVCAINLKDARARSVSYPYYFYLFFKHRTD